MIQNIVKVKSTTTLQGKKGPYLSVVWTDGDKEFKKNIFEPAHQKVFQEAEKSGESVNVGVEKEGDFWNVKTAVITSEEVKAEPKQATKPSQELSQRADEILLSVAFKGAVECEDWYVPDGKSHEDRVLLCTKELYLGLKSVLGGKDA